jgi:hypothetical protein
VTTTWGAVGVAVPAALGDGQGTVQQGLSGGPIGRGANGDGPPGQQGTDATAAHQGTGPGQWNGQGAGHGPGQGIGPGPALGGGAVGHGPLGAVSHGAVGTAGHGPVGAVGHGAAGTVSQSTAIGQSVSVGAQGGPVQVSARGNGHGPNAGPPGRGPNAGPPGRGPNAGPPGRGPNPGPPEYGPNGGPFGQTHHAYSTVTGTAGKQTGNVSVNAESVVTWASGPVPTPNSTVIYQPPAAAASAQSSEI